MAQFHRTVCVIVPRYQPYLLTELTVASNGLGVVGGSTSTLVALAGCIPDSKPTPRLHTHELTFQNRLCQHLPPSLLCPGRHEKPYNVVRDFSWRVCHISRTLHL
jgi:hypothetical protein